MYKSILMVLLLTFFIGCGGGSSSSTDYSTSPKVTLINTQASKDTNGNVTDLTTNIIFTEQNSNLHNVLFSLLDVTVPGCTVNSFNLNPTSLNNAQSGILTLSLSGCQSVDTLIFNVSEKADYTDTVEKSKTETKSITTKIESITYTTSSSSSSTLDTTAQDNSTSSYASRLIVLPKKVNITNPSQIETIKIITVDENNRPISAKILMNKLIDENDTEYGTLDKYEAITNDQGEAFITYTAPQNINNLLNTDKNIVFEIANTSIEKNVTLEFNSSTTSVNTPKLILLPNKLDITKPNQQETIKIITVDKDNKPISKKVFIHRLVYGSDNNYTEYGTLDSYEVTTNEEGEAYVTYTAPKDMSKVDNTEQNITFEIENTSISQNTILNFHNTGTENGEQNIVVLPKTLKITEPNQQEQLKIITVDENNRPISTQVLINKLIDTNDNEYGTLDSYEVTTNEEGEAYVTYTAPNDIKNITDKNITFSLANNDKINQNVGITFVVPDTNATEYDLDLIMPNSIAVYSKNSFTIKIFKKSDNSVYIDDKYVNDVNVSIEGTNLFFNSDRNVSTYEYNQSSAKSIDIWSNKYACIEFVDVNASIFNGEENVTISKTFKVVIVSGPINSISINYLNTIYDSDDGLFVEKYAIHAVDAYSNPANAGSKIYFGAVNGIKLYGEDNGSVGLNGSDTEFNVSDTNLNDYDVQEQDVVAILASSNKIDSRYLGGWIIKELVDDDTVYFSCKYDGETTDKLKFVIGNEKRYDSCGDSLALIDIDSTDGTYEVDSEGIAYATIKYDPFLVGKTVTLYANSMSENRVGVSKKTILFGTGTVNPGSLICETLDKTEDKNCSLTFGIDIKDASGGLKNTDLRETFVTTDEKGSCKILSESNFTNCTGAYTLTVEVEKNTSCTVTWSNAINYEY